MGLGQGGRGSCGLACGQQTRSACWVWHEAKLDGLTARTTPRTLCSMALQASPLNQSPVGPYLGQVAWGQGQDERDQGKTCACSTSSWKSHSAMTWVSLLKMNISRALLRPTGSEPLVPRMCILTGSSVTHCLRATGDVLSVLGVRLLHFSWAAWFSASHRHSLSLSFLISDLYNGCHTIISGLTERI